MYLRLRSTATQPSLPFALIITVNEYPKFHTLQEGFFSHYHEETHQEIAQRS